MINNSYLLENFALMLIIIHEYNTNLITDMKY